MPKVPTKDAISRKDIRVYSVVTKLELLRLIDAMRDAVSKNLTYTGLIDFKETIPDNYIVHFIVIKRRKDRPKSISEFITDEIGRDKPLY